MANFESGSTRGVCDEISPRCSGVSTFGSTAQVAEATAVFDKRQLALAGDELRESPARLEAEDRLLGEAHRRLERRRSLQHTVDGLVSCRKTEALLDAHARPAVERRPRRSSDAARGADDADSDLADLKRWAAAALHKEPLPDVVDLAQTQVARESGGATPALSSFSPSRVSSLSPSRVSSLSPSRRASADFGFRTASRDRSRRVSSRVSSRERSGANSFDSGPRGALVTPESPCALSAASSRAPSAATSRAPSARGAPTRRRSSTGIHVVPKPSSLAAVV